MTSVPTPALAGDSFSASVGIGGGSVYITAPSLTILAALLAKLQDPAQQPTAAVTAVEKAAVLGNAPAPAPVSKPKAQPKAEPQADASSSAAPADKPSSAATLADASAVSYDDVKKVVNALYAIDPDHIIGLLGEFNVKHGKDLDPRQWLDFVAAGKAKLDALKAEARA